MDTKNMKPGKADKPVEPVKQDAKTSGKQGTPRKAQTPPRPGTKPAR